MSQRTKSRLKTRRQQKKQEAVRQRRTMFAVIAVLAVAVVAGLLVLRHLNAGSICESVQPSQDPSIIGSCEYAEYDFTVDHNSEKMVIPLKVENRLDGDINFSREAMRERYQRLIDEMEAIAGLSFSNYVAMEIVIDDSNHFELDGSFEWLYESAAELGYGTDGAVPQAFVNLSPDGLMLIYINTSSIRYDPAIADRPLEEAVEALLMDELANSLSYTWINWELSEQFSWSAFYTSLFLSDEVPYQDYEDEITDIVIPGYYFANQQSQSVIAFDPNFYGDFERIVSRRQFVIEMP